MKSAYKRTTTFNVHMTELGVKSRRVWVYLPPNYASSKLRYPVLYMHDGQNLFDPKTSFCGAWGVDKTIDNLFREGKTGGVIVVGVDNGGDARWNEYSPWGNHDGTGRCRGARYAAFLVNELKPLIDRKYRTLPDRKCTGIAGSSLGGIISFYTALKYPDVFSRVGIFSPSFWFARAHALTLVERAHTERGLHVYMDVGTEEGDHQEDYLNDAKAVAEAFSRKKGVILNFVVDEGGIHNESAWARRFPAAYLWLFKKA